MNFDTIIDWIVDKSGVVIDYAWQYWYVPLLLIGFVLLRIFGVI